MDVLKDIGADHSMQISVHKIEHQVDISIVLRTNHILQPDYVLVAWKLLQEDDLTESTLGISCILECIEVFL